MKIFLHLGDIQPDYRSIMREQSDFQVGDKIIPTSRVVIAEQIHSDLVYVCSEADCGAGFGTHPQIDAADAMVTDIPGQYLLIRTADCTPVLLHDIKARAVGAVHSGREGTRKNIVGKAVASLKQHYNVEPQDVVAHIGAGICGEHYPVSEEVWQQFNASLQDLDQAFQSFRPWHLDIRLCVFRQLLQAGVPFKNIEQDHTCTYESQRHFSYRRDGTHNRQINLIGIENE
ncbi:MAG TPA: polyphenol oxidase family protein [Candidatus Cloacimonadota bacterium]|nr:polyphenol oxidase family protein [Candidatus Cloacimonadota bacterium]